MEQFAVDDLFINLMAERGERIKKVYSECTKQIEEFLKKKEATAAKTLEAYFLDVERRRSEEIKRRERQKQAEAKRKSREIQKKNAARKADPNENTQDRKRRKSMVVHIDDMSFCFGKEDLEQISGKGKKVDPEVKNVLQQMNELFKKLNK